MKGIFCLILVVLTWGESVEGYWSLMKSGRYGEAAAKIETYLAEGRKVTDAERIEGDALIMKANICQEMLDKAPAMNIVGTVNVIKKDMLETCLKVMSDSRMKMNDDGGSEFVSIRGNKRLVSIKGKEGYDIYRQYSGEELERLSDVVNTKGNELFPYEMSDGVTLYFGSNGHGSIGGYDIFMTRYNSEVFDYSEPQNVGMPYNSLANDYLMMVDDINGITLWATDNGMTGDSVRIVVVKMADEDASAKRRESKKVGEFSDYEDKMVFVLTDAIVYHKLDDFRSEEARAMYVSMNEMKGELAVDEFLLEDKRGAYTEMTDDEAKEQMRKEILEDEKYVKETKNRIRQMIKNIRQLELKQYE